MNTANPDPSLGRNQLPNPSQEHNQQQQRTKEVGAPPKVPETDIDPDADCADREKLQDEA